MFYVFGLGGPIYRGTMENLSELSPVRALSATRGVHRSDALHRDAFELPAATPRPPSNALHTRRNDAMAAYADAQQAKPPARQPLDRVQDVMSREVFSVPPELTVAEAWEALAARGLPAHLQRKAIVWGTVGAIGIRALMTLVVVWLLKIPGLMLVGGLGLLWIAYKLLVDEGGDEEHGPVASTFQE